MISFHYETQFELPNEAQIEQWISKVIASEDKREGDINYIFCNDEYLHKLNVEFLNHDTLTDIITFDYTEGKVIEGDVFISLERVLENAEVFNVSFEDEILRVLSHGVLHLIGYKDKSDDDKKLMREKEDEKMNLFHVEH